MKQVFITGLIIVSVMGFFYIWLHHVNKIKREQFEKEKICYRDLTRIIENSSKAKAEWIQNTIIAGKNIVGPNYCGTLELVQSAERP